MMPKNVVVGEEWQEEKEMDLLLSEIPHLTSLQGHHGGTGHGHGHGHTVHGAPRHHGHAVARDAQDTYYALFLNRHDDRGHYKGGGGGSCHASFSMGSTPSSASSPMAGSTSSPLSQTLDDPERQWLVAKLRGLLIGNAAAAESQAALAAHGLPAPSTRQASTDVSAALRANYGYSFGAPGPSVHQEPLFLDPAMSTGYVGRSQRCVDASLNGFGSFSRSLDASIGVPAYNRTGNGIGIGKGQDLVHPELSEALLLPCQIGAERSWEYGNMSSIGVGARGSFSKLHYGVPVTSDRYMRRGFNEIEAFQCEDSLIIDEKKHMHLLERGRKLQQHVNVKSPELDSPKMLEYENMIGVRGYIYFMAKDQNGCRFLQEKFEEGKHHVDVIFEGVIDHIAELMINPFGNYLVQKLLEVCDEEQRLRVIVALTEDPMRLLKISLNTHGTRAVQKLIETVQSRQQILLIVSALHPGFIHLVKDLNGNHVIQKCLTNFGIEENKFILDAAITRCFEMAIHRHGCCVLQRCISTACGEYQAKLIVEICANGFQLSQDPFGNYVVQYVLGLKIPSANANLATQFEGSYVYLSKQKVSSNVVEKCLKVFPEEDKAAIIFDLISVSHFEQLLQDPFANYVIHTALLNTKGPMHNALVEAIRPHEEALRTSPCCKRISRAVSRK